MRLQEGFLEDICVVKASGRLTIGDGSSAFRHYIQQRISGGMRHFIWDFSEISFIDSSGFGELVNAFTRIKMRAGRLVLVDTPYIQQLLAITKTGTVFDTASDISHAISMFRGEPEAAPEEIKYEDKFSIAIEGEKKQKKMVVQDNISDEPLRKEYRIRDIPSEEDARKLQPKWLILVVLVSVLTLGATIYGLVWAAKAVSSIVLLTLIFSLALLFFIVLAALVLLLSGHLSEKTAAKLFGGALAKLPTVGSFVAKDKKSD